MDMLSSSVPVPSTPPQNSLSVSENSVCELEAAPMPSRYLRLPLTSLPQRLSNRSAADAKSAACSMGHSPPVISSLGDGLGLSRLCPLSRLQQYPHVQSIMAVDNLIAPLLRQADRPTWSLKAGESSGTKLPTLRCAIGDSAAFMMPLVFLPPPITS